MAAMDRPAVAATLAAVLVLIDVVRKYVFAYLSERALWSATVCAHELLFAPTVAIAAPLDGDFVLTVGFPADGEITVTDLGTLLPLAGGNDNTGRSAS